MKITEFCYKHKACREGREWALSLGIETMEELWLLEDMKPDWRQWIAARPGVLTDRELRLFACWCVRQVWHLLQDDRSRNAVVIAERFANGEATTEELRAAADASAARAAASAAYARAAASAAARAAASAYASAAASAAARAADDADAYSRAADASAAASAAAARAAAAAAYSRSAADDAAADDADAYSRAADASAAASAAGSAADAAQANFLREETKPNFGGQ
jgi:hypothetical protein